MIVFNDINAQCNGICHVQYSNDKMKLSKSSNYDNFATIKNQTVCRGNRRCVVMVTELGWEFTGSEKDNHFFPWSS